MNRRGVASIFALVVVSCDQTSSKEESVSREGLSATSGRGGTLSRGNDRYGAPEDSPVGVYVEAASSPT